MSRVLRTDLADDDLMEIGDYIRRRSGSADVAFRLRSSPAAGSGDPRRAQ